MSWIAVSEPAETRKLPKLSSVPAGLSATGLNMSLRPMPGSSARPSSYSAGGGRHRRPRGRARGVTPVAEARKLGGVDRRIFGVETEYGVTCTFRGQRRLSPDEVARYLFRRVVSWGR